MLLSSLTLSLDTAYISRQALVLKNQDSFKAAGYTQGTFCSLLHFKACMLASPVDIVGANEDTAVPGVCGSAETYALVPLWEF